jgi:hypothetical protein
LTQQVINEHDGCLFSKSNPPQPGQRDAPKV